MTFSFELFNCSPFIFGVVLVSLHPPHPNGRSMPCCYFVWDNEARMTLHQPATHKSLHKLKNDNTIYRMNQSDTQNKRIKYALRIKRYRGIFLYKKSTFKSVFMSIKHSTLYGFLNYSFDFDETYT